MTTLDDGPHRGPDFAACEAEPIRTPAAIQPHGAMLVIDAASSCCTHASANLGDFIGTSAAAAIGRSVGELLGEDVAARLARLVAAPGDAGEPLVLGRVPAPADGGRAGPLAVAHRDAAAVFVELEPDADVEPDAIACQAALRRIVDRFETARSLDELQAAAAAGVRALLGHARVLVYRFDAHHNGEVVAEVVDDGMPRYLGLHFPATDIPAQARALYRVNRIRQIADAGARPVALVPTDPAAALDLGFAWLRAVSPAHLDYLRAMQVGASFSIAIVVEGSLWGMISCHHPRPRTVGAAARQTCDQLGRMLALQVAAHHRHAQAHERLARRDAQIRALARMAEVDGLAPGLAAAGQALLEVVAADGVAILLDDRIDTTGFAPPPDVLREIARRLSALGGDRFDGDRFELERSDAAADADDAFGVLSIRISRIHPHFVIWFRRARHRTVRWAGRVDGDGARRAQAIGPARSFETWVETVGARCEPWTEVDRDAAAAMRVAIVDIVLRRAEEIAAMAERLRAANAELEAFSYSVSHDLRAPLRHIAGYTDLLLEGEAGELGERARHFAANARDAARHAAKLLDDLLAFSQMGRSMLQVQPLDLAVLVDELVAQFDTGIRTPPGGPRTARRVAWSVGPLPTVRADPSMMRIVFSNLIDNALKYTRMRETATIAIGAEDRGDAWLIRVTDNGVGFDPAYAGKLFGLFQRLHRADEFEGTGIGLASVRRIVSRHGGHTWADARPDAGAAFSFSLPKSAPA